MIKQLKFSGIQRSMPQDSFPDGSLQEAINMRFRKNAWRPKGAMREAYNASYTYEGSTITFKRIYIHDIEGGLNNEPNWIGYRDTNPDTVYHINPNTGVCTLIDTLQDTNDYTTVTFLKRTMIITTNAGLYTYLYSDGIYSKMVALPTPSVELTSAIYLDPAIAPSGGVDWNKAVATVISDPATLPEGVIGNYYAAINRQSSNNGRLYGSIMYIVCYRLFDGSYIMHSIPRYLEISNGGILRCNNPKNDGWGNAQWRWVLKMGQVSGKILTTANFPVAQFENVSEIVDSVVVFATPCTPLFKVDAETVTKTLLESGNGSLDWQDRNFTTLFPVNAPDFSELAKSAGWYQILEFPFSDILATPSSITKEADTKGYYQDYATRKALPTDNFTHHALVAKSAFVYNDHLHILSVKTLFEDPQIMWENYTGYNAVLNTQAIIVVHLSTGLGKVVITRECTIPSYLNTNTGVYYFVQPSVIGYPDSRATKIEIAINDGGAYKLLYSINLVKNESINFAYFCRTEFSIIDTATNNYRPLWIAASSLSIAYTVPAAKAPTYDPNRLQVSEIQNPLFFPAKYSYQVGTGEGIAVCAGSEPLSAGQFGQFPLQVFTTKGRWALQQGSGDILYASIQPVDGEVVDNPLNVVSVGSGVAYSTLKGLFIAQGMQTVKISELVEGIPDGHVRDLSQIDFLLTDNRCTPGLHGTLSTADFLTYLTGSQICYDHINKEIVVTNPAYSFSYVYSLEYKIWYKISKSFSLLINAYPTIYGVTADKVFDIADDEREGNTQCLLISNALSLDNPDGYKKIERAIMRSDLSTAVGSYAGIYLFASDDLTTYRLVTGKQRSGAGLKDMIMQRSPGSAKYYVIVFNGFITHKSSISGVDILSVSTLNNKLR